ncbi:MAG: DUF1735 and LamG domain-containing protein [Bacteroidales bacterium]|nr:DUF1735 and LamG domain-containing protein [Bacteroidales bacterium]
MKTSISCSLSAVFALIMLSSCQKPDFGSNSIYFTRTSGETVSEMLVSSEDSMEGSISVSIPQKRDVKISAVMNIAPELLDEFNLKYGEKATILDEKFYEIENDKFEIAAGSVSSNDLSIKFCNLLELEKKHDETYLLPLVLSSADAKVVEGRDVKYFFLRGANLINFAPFLDGDYDIDSEVVYDPGNYFMVDWKDKALVTGWSSFTYEGLFCGQINKWNAQGDSKRSNPEGIVSLLGTEKGVLLRWWRNSGYYNKFRWLEFKGLGVDADACVHLEMPYRDSQNDPPLYDEWKHPYGLPNDEWFTLTASYDGPTGVVKCWLNGEKVCEKVIDKNIELRIYPEGKKEPEFYFGHANGEYHWWPGMMSEIRLWNRALEDEEILSDPLHYYTLSPEGAQGLIGYWKLNEGSGNICKDYSGYGNDAVAKYKVDWRKVSLPAE